jgi:hypothetical protein
MFDQLVQFGLFQARQVPWESSKFQHPNSNAAPTFNVQKCDDLEVFATRTGPPNARIECFCHPADGLRENVAS